MVELFDKEGNVVEAFSAEELQAQKDAAIEEFKQANPDKSSELEILQSQLREKEDELVKLRGKDTNFENLRKQKNAAEKAAEELRREIDEKIGAVKKEVLDGVMKDHYNETIGVLAGNDEELKKKIEFHYNRLQDSAVTKDEVSKKLRDAWVLATKLDDPGALNSSVISSGGVSKLNIKNTQKFTPEEKAIGAKFGLSEKDFETYGGK